jgi:heptosyltransferase-1
MAEVLFVRLGAFGDVLHALPAAASLKRGLPGARLTWVIEPRWKWLLAGNPDVDDVIELNRRSLESVRTAWGALRARRFDIAVDAQGLLKSAVAARVSRAPVRIGYARGVAREGASTMFYTSCVTPTGAHVVEHGLALAAAAGSEHLTIDFPLPSGTPEGVLPDGPFVLAAPFAGWKAKQWPLAYYGELAGLLKPHGVPLVLNVAPGVAVPEGVTVHTSSLDGLIYATRRAAAVVGLDSGPMHLAAALRKKGVALFGPTDPARNGPYGGTLHVMRDPSAPTTYRRIDELLPCMRALSPRRVFENLLPCLATSSPNPTPTR